VDRQTLELLAAGDREAFERCLRFVAQWAIGKGDAPVDAEDISEEAVFRAALRADTYRGKSSVATWIIGIAENVRKEHFRHRTRKVSWAASLDDNPIEVQNDVDVEDMALRQMAAEEAMQKLTPDERQAFLLCVRDGLTSHQAGERIGKSADRVRHLKMEAARKLADYWRDFRE